jgi:hypothetical protein
MHAHASLPPGPRGLPARPPARRYCLHSRAFQADRTAIFDRIVSVIGQQVERGQEDNACLAYWLTNTVTLLNMLNKNIKPASGSLNKPRSGAAGAASVGAATRSVLGAMFGSRHGGGGSPAAGAGAAGGAPGGAGYGEASRHGGGVGERPAPAPPCASATRPRVLLHRRRECSLHTHKPIMHGLGLPLLQPPPHPPQPPTAAQLHTGRDYTYT